MTAGLLSLRARTITYLFSAAFYFACAVLFASILSKIFTDAFSIIAVGTTLFGTLASANILISTAMFIVALFRLLVLGAAKDYERSPKN